MKTTLNKILAAAPCGQGKGSGYGWDKLLTFLGKTEPDDEELPLLTILESNGIQDAIWALRTVDGYDREIRLMAADFAELVLPNYEKEYPDDDRPRKAIQSARDYANGIITKIELSAVSAAATSAALSAESAARSAAWSAESAAWSAALSAESAARSAARSAAWPAESAAWSAALSAAWSAARSAAWSAWSEIESIFKKYMKMKTAEEIELYMRTHSPYQLGSQNDTDCKNGFERGVAYASQQWVSVDERLPENSIPVLGCNKNGYCFCVWYHTVKKEFLEGVHYFNEKHSYPITHWMPLPTPPIN